jgi:hypothetical protein
MKTAISAIHTGSCARQPAGRRIRSPACIAEVPDCVMHAAGCLIRPAVCVMHSEIPMTRTPVRMRQIGERMMREPVREIRAVFLAIRERLFLSRRRLSVMHEGPLVNQDAGLLARKGWRVIHPRMRVMSEPLAASHV